MFFLIVFAKLLLVIDLYCKSDAEQAYCLNNNVIVLSCEYHIDDLCRNKADWHNVCND